MRVIGVIATGGPGGTNVVPVETICDVLKKFICTKIYRGLLMQLRSQSMTTRGRTGLPPLILP